MKNYLLLTLVMIAVTLSGYAQEPKSTSSTRRVGLEIRQTQETATTVHRAPGIINIEVYYNETVGSLDVYYDGEANGETFLYLNNSIIGYDSEINTSFQIFTPGHYIIEIIGDSWIATGHIEL